jgi:hypothetical protein
MHETYKSNLLINYLKWLRKLKGNIVKTLTLWRRAPKIKVLKNVENMFRGVHQAYGKETKYQYRTRFRKTLQELSIFNIFWPELSCLLKLCGNYNKTLLLLFLSKIHRTGTLWKNSHVTYWYREIHAEQDMHVTYWYRVIHAEQDMGVTYWYRVIHAERDMRVTYWYRVIHAEQDIRVTYWYRVIQLEQDTQDLQLNESHDIVIFCLGKLCRPQYIC